jgi:hypothetical protein
VIIDKEKEVNEIIYQTSITNHDLVSQTNSKPFGSKHGKTFTFSWCSGSDRILIKNKIYFSSSEEALASGRSLSKLCKK